MSDESKIYVFLTPCKDTISPISDMVVYLLNKKGLYWFYFNLTPFHLIKSLYNLDEFKKHINSWLKKGACVEVTNFNQIIELKQKMNIF